MYHYHTFTQDFLLDYQQKNYFADRTDGMEWTLAEDYCTQTHMTDAVLASSSFEADTQASQMQDTAAAHKAGMFQANAGKKSGDSNDSSQECEEHNAFEEPVDIQKDLDKL